LDASKELMLAEYQRIKEAFAANEKDGNTRINLFITLTTSLMSAFGITKQFENNANTGILFFPVLLSLFFLGFFILRRLIHRNINTDSYKYRFDKIREYFQSYDPVLKNYPLFPPMKSFSNKERIKQWKKWYSPGTGGYVQIIVLLNSIIFAFILIVIFSSPLIMNIFVNDNQYKDIKDNSTATNIQKPNNTLTTEENNFDIPSSKNNYYYIIIPVIFFATLGIHYVQYNYVMKLYKEEEKEKIIKDKLSFSKTLESILPQEEELSFIILSDDPENIIDRIKNTPKIKRYELVKKNRKIKITDRYYDVNENTLQQNKYSLRMRIEKEKEEKKFLAFKGPTKISSAGNPIRIEVEKEWNLDEIKTILLELKKLIPWINIQLDRSDFDLDFHAVLEKIGFKEIQKRETEREEIGVIVQDPFKLATEFAIMYIDNVIFDFSNVKIQIKYFNIEIEINKKKIEVDQLIKPIHDRYSYFLSDFKEKFLLLFPEIKEWPHSKYLTGKAIQTLIYTNDFKDSIDEKGNLRYIDYKKIDNLIKEKKL